LQFALALTWARRCAPLPTLHLHQAQNSDLHFAPIYEPGMSSGSGRDHGHWVSREKYGQNAGREAPSTVDRGLGEGANSAQTIFISHRFASQAKRPQIRAFREWCKYLAFRTTRRTVPAKHSMDYYVV
jgi:hypothetical protein